MLTILDTFTRYSPAVDPSLSYRAEDVVKTLERVCREAGYLKRSASIRAWNSSPRDLDLWAYHKGVILDFSRAGKPGDNAFIESFNGEFRSECLNAHWFMSLDAAQRKRLASRQQTADIAHKRLIGSSAANIGR